MYESDRIQVNGWCSRTSKGREMAGWIPSAALRWLRRENGDENGDAHKEKEKPAVTYNTLSSP